MQAAQPESLRLYLIAAQPPGRLVRKACDCGADVSD
jgi:hypothetical protein